MGQLIFKKALPHLLAIVTFLILSIVYFYPQLEGKIVQSGDIISHQGMSKEMRDLRDRGETPLWTNSMFGGMPGYQIGVPYSGNKIGWLEKVMNLFIGRPIGYFVALMIGFYLMMVLLGVNPWLSIIGAVAFGFSSNHLVLFEAGHMTKLRVIAQYGPIIAGLLLVFKRKYFLGGALFAAAMAIAIYANHIQMTYFLGIITMIYVLIEIIRHIKAGEWGPLVKAGLVLSVGLLLAIGASTANLWTNYEYSKDTMRGSPILKKASNATAVTSSEVEGLEWNYAMQWSNGFMDVMASMIPGVVGGGSREQLSSSSELAVSMRKKGAQIKEGPLYWGALPFTSGPVYIGAIMCFLFILGLLTVDGPIKWWLGIGVLLTFLLSMGKNFEILNRFIFDYFPLYNKFRAPSSITSVTTILVPFLGLLGLSRILEGRLIKEQALKKLYIASGIGIAIPLFFALVGPSMFDFSSSGDAQYQQSGYDVAAIVADRKALMRTDSFRTLLLILFAAGLIGAYLKDKISQPILLAGMALLVLFDTWSVGKRYLGVDKFSNSSITDQYKVRPADQQIFAAENINPENLSLNPVGRGGYRVLDMSINTFNSSSTSYFHNTIGGYHAAKLQRFQDLIDFQINNGNQAVLNMLNAKYYINQQGKVQQNPNATGTAWFVDAIKTVTTPNEEMEGLNDLKPATEAIVLDAEFNNYVGSFKPQKNGTINLSNYKPGHLVYTSSTNSEQFAVFSEVWYGPDKGWQAYIDGTPAPHIRANYLLRAMKIPAGQHKIEFKFEPKAFLIGEKISLFSSLLILLSFLGVLGYMFYTRKDKWLEDLAANEKSVVTKKAIVKTKSKNKNRNKKSK